MHKISVKGNTYENVLPRNARLSDPITHFLFVAVHCCRVDVPVAAFQGCDDGVADFVFLRLLFIRQI